MGLKVWLKVFCLISPGSKSFGLMGTAECTKHGIRACTHPRTHDNWFCCKANSRFVTHGVCRHVPGSPCRPCRRSLHTKMEETRLDISPAVSVALQNISALKKWKSRRTNHLNMWAHFFGSSSVCFAFFVGACCVGGASCPAVICRFFDFLVSQLLLSRTNLTWELPMAEGKGFNL